MTYKRILQLAADEALRIWAEEKKHFDAMPNSLSEFREQKAMREYEEIRTALIAEEKKNRK